jgi:hypothetical protein
LGKKGFLEGGFKIKSIFLANKWEIWTLDKVLDVRDGAKYGERLR